MSDEEIRAAVALSNDVSSLKSAKQGAATSAWCATSSELEGMGGVYCEDTDIAEAVAADFPAPRGVRPWAMDKDFAERLWTMSEIWTGATLSE